MTTTLTIDHLRQLWRSLPKIPRYVLLYYVKDADLAVLGTTEGEVEAIKCLEHELEMVLREWGADGWRVHNISRHELLIAHRNDPNYLVLFGESTTMQRILIGDRYYVEGACCPRNRVWVTVGDELIDFKREAGA